MEDLRKLLPSAKAVNWMLAGGAALFTILLLHKLFIKDTGLFEEGPPLLTPWYLLLSLLVALAAVCYCVALVTWRRKCSGEKNSANPAQGSTQYWIIAASLFISGIFIGVFLFAPSHFSDLSLEDGVVEWASALLLFGCTLAFIGVFLSARKTPSDTKLLRWGALLLASIFFVIGMEEISWMQRVIGLETSPAFQSNIQGEMNLHNFATEPVELAYYFGAFVFTVLLPFMRWQHLFPLKRNEFDLLIPRPWILYIGVIACGYNFDMWNIFLIQGTFWASCFILLYILMLGYNRWLAACVLLAVIASQALFLTFDSHYAREWELTEYKEFFLPLAFLAYSLDVLRRARLRVTSPATDRRRSRSSPATNAS